MDKIRSNSGKVDIISYSDKFYTHKQIERKHGMVFMRIKRRLRELEV